MVPETLAAMNGFCQLTSETVAARRFQSMWTVNMEALGCKVLEQCHTGYFHTRREVSQNRDPQCIKSNLVYGTCLYANNTRLTALYVIADVNLLTSNTTDTEQQMYVALRQTNN